MNKDIGKIRKDINSRNCREVYEAIFKLNKVVKLREIMDELRVLTHYKNLILANEAYEKCNRGQYTEEQAKNYIKENLWDTISEKTVQRCILSDPRIQKDRRKYSITQKARLEARNLLPGDFGLQMVYHILGKKHPPEQLEPKIKYFIMRFGAYIFFNFIEAVRPFQDESLDIRQREELVSYWAINAIPLESMFQLFQGSFDGRPREVRRKHDWKTPFSEMKQESIEQLLAAFQKAIPEIYEDLMQARNHAFIKV